MLRPSEMVLILFRLHLEDVRDDAVDLDVPDEAGEEEVLNGLWVEGPERREEEEEPGEPVPVPGVALAGRVLQLSHGLILERLDGVMICKTRGLLLFQVVTQIRDWCEVSGGCRD